MTEQEVARLTPLAEQLRGAAHGELERERAWRERAFFAALSVGQPVPVAAETALDSVLHLIKLQDHYDAWAKTLRAEWPDGWLRRAADDEAGRRPAPMFKVQG